MLNVYRQTDLTSFHQTVNLLTHGQLIIRLKTWRFYTTLLQFKGHCFLTRWLGCCNSTQSKSLNYTKYAQYFSTCAPPYSWSYCRNRLIGEKRPVTAENDIIAHSSVNEGREIIWPHYLNVYNNKLTLKRRTILVKTVSNFFFFF